MDVNSSVFYSIFTDNVCLHHLQRPLARGDVHPPADELVHLHPGANGRHEPAVYRTVHAHRPSGLHVHPDLCLAGCHPVFSHAVPQVTSQIKSKE